MKRFMWLSWPVLCVPLLLGPAVGAEQPSRGVAPRMVDQGASDEGSINGEAMDILKRMSETLAQAQHISATVRAEYDVMQETGEKIEFSERRTVTLSRPNGLRVETQQSDGTRTEVTFDGKAITLFDPDDNVYGQIEKPGSLDDAMRFVVKGLHVRLPLGLLLVGTLPAEWAQRLEALNYVERNTLTAVPTDHLVGETENADFQIWIAATGTPLPQRVTVTYWRDEGEPQYRANLIDWSLNPDVSSTQFAFRPPTGAERIPLLTEDHQAVSGASPTEAPAPTTQNKAARWVRYPDVQDDIWEYAPADDAFPATATPIVPVITSAHVTELPCTPTMVTADEKRYYRCDGTWYSRGYIDGDVSYITAAPPPNR